MKYLKLLGATALFGVLLLVVYVVHVRYVPVNVVFYSAILDDVLATGLTLLLLAALGWLRSFSRFEIAQMVCIWLLLGYSFAISVPTVVDRSLSFYILEKLQQRGVGVGAESHAVRCDAFSRLELINASSRSI